MTSPKQCSIKKVLASDVCKNLPSMSPWEGSKLDNIELLIVAAGFEDRTRAFPDELENLNSLSVENILVGIYDTNKEDNANAYKNVGPTLKNICSNIEETKADFPEDILRKIKNLTVNWDSKKHIAFDISGASAPFICTVIGAIYDLDLDIKFTILYSEAKTYNEPQNLDTPTKNWSEEDIGERGVSVVDINPIFKGTLQENTDQFVVAFPSLSKSRLACCLNYFSHELERFAMSRVAWVLPSTTSPTHQWRRKKIEETIISCWDPDDADNSPLNSIVKIDNIIECDILSYEESTKILLELADYHLGENVGAILMGSKLQTLGAALAICVKQEVTSLYARPEEFDAKNYSSGVGRLWMISFDEFRNSVGQLGECGQLVLHLQDGTQKC